MISYEPFFHTLKEKNLTTYRLIRYYGVSRSLIDRLKHNRPLSTVTINDLCTMLECPVQDILEYYPDYLIEEPSTEKHNENEKPLP